MKYFLILNYYC